MKKIYLGADHAGFKLKEELKSYLHSKGYDYEDLGNTQYEPTDDYPDFGYKVANKVADTDSRGILVCGSSQGVCMVANKVKGVRAAAVASVEDAIKTREHNNANVICLSGWNLKKEGAEGILDKWLNTPFSKEERHRRRVNKILKIENMRWKK